MRLAQRLLRGGRIGWVFVTPNLIVFGLFTFLPILIDFVYAFTGGSQLFPSQRPYVGTANLQALLTCKNYLDPNSCVRDLFWHGVFNTTKFVALQVGLMVVLSLITALALNRPGGRPRFLPRRVLLPRPAFPCRRRADLEMGAATLRRAQRRARRGRSRHA